MNNNYTVYMHVSPSNKKYIGITGMDPIKRWNSGHGYSNKYVFGKAIKKYSWKCFKHEILLENLTKEEAEKKEKELIALYKTHDIRYGYNQELGGNLGKEISNDSRLKMSRAKIGKRPYNYGSKLTNEQKQRLRQINIGKKLSEETKLKISNSTKGIKNKRSLSVNQFTSDGVLVKTWNCMMDIEREIGISNSKVCAVCKGKRKTAGGYIWRYADARL